MTFSCKVHNFETEDRIEWDIHLVTFNHWHEGETLVDGVMCHFKIYGKSLILQNGEHHFSLGSD
jgi:hypothetical protein